MRVISFQTYCQRNRIPFASWLDNLDFVKGVISGKDEFPYYTIKTIFTPVIKYPSKVITEYCKEKDLGNSVYYLAKGITPTKVAYYEFHIFHKKLQ